jgi:phosphate transport system permease protein
MEISRETRLLQQAKSRLETPSRRLGFVRATKDFLARILFGWAALVVCALVIIIAALLTMRSWPLLNAYPLRDLLTGQDWHPMRGMFGFAPFIIGSLAVTSVAALIAVIPAILSGIYLAEYTTTRLRTTLKPLIDLLVGIPSVVYGLWGILFVVPLVRDHIGPWSHQTLGSWIPFFRQTNPSGYGLLSAGFVLAIMVFPLIVAVTDEVMRSVPSAMREATLSLGANRWEATKCVVRHAALPGILAAVVLGFSRAFGETLAVMMLVGNMPQMPRSIFDGAYPLPALIANNYGEMMSVPLYESALMSAALILLLVILGFNIGARLIIERIRKER